jgi:hypothetical protein
VPSVHPCAIRAAVSVLLLIAGPSVAQSDAQPRPRSTGWLVGVSVGAFGTSHPQGGALVLGGNLGLERSVASRLAVRGSVSRTVVVGAGDDLSICYLLPDGSCRPDALFPNRLWTLEVAGVARPVDILPIRLLVGGGLALPSDARRNIRRSPSIDSTIGARTTLRLGAELSLGRSRHALRFQAARSGYSRSMLSANALTTLAVVLPL